MVISHDVEALHMDLKNTIDKTYFALGLIQQYLQVDIILVIYKSRNYTYMIFTAQKYVWAWSLNRNPLLGNSLILKEQKRRRKGLFLFLLKEVCLFCMIPSITKSYGRVDLS